MILHGLQNDVKRCQRVLAGFRSNYAVQIVQNALHYLSSVDVSLRRYDGLTYDSWQRPSSVHTCPAARICSSFASPVMRMAGI